jgi:hypothetical protein
LVSAAISDAVSGSGFGFSPVARAAVRTDSMRSRARCIFAPSARSIRPRISASANRLALRRPEVEIQEQRPKGQDFGQRILAGVHARTHARFHRRGQQRLPNPLRESQPGRTRTFLQQGELRLRDLRGD